MPIHFSIGFVVTEKYDTQYITVCGAAYDDLKVRSVIDTLYNAVAVMSLKNKENIFASITSEVTVNAASNNMQEVVAVWIRKGAECR